MSIATTANPLDRFLAKLWSWLWPFGRDEPDAAPLYRAVVEQARDARFYALYRVPDTIDGRFDLIALHMFLVLHRLKSGDKTAAALGQALFDALFRDLDRTFRDIGATDLGVGKRVRAMAEALYGRIQAYDTGLAAGDEALKAALSRNLYGTAAEKPDDAMLSRLCLYIRDSVASLARQEVTRFAAGEPGFPDVPAS